jgi:hypothetical protein
VPCVTQENYNDGHVDWYVELGSVIPQRITSMPHLPPCFSFRAAEFPPTQGDATLAGFSLSHEPEKTRRRIGYCPQFDAHFANMTGREHVEVGSRAVGTLALLVV